MNQQKTGKFIAELRHEKLLTQERLGERLGVTNKTISRWENGTYMPDIDKLQALSAELGVTINELLSGERIPDDSFRAKADETLTAVLRESPFALKERIAFWKRKWLTDHLALIIGLLVVGVAAVLWCGFMQWFAAEGGVFLGGVVLYLVMRNTMMIYVERRAFDPPERTDVK